MDSDEEWDRLLRDPPHGGPCKDNDVGKLARAEFYRLYRNNGFDKALDRPASARSVYLQQLDSMGMCPEPMGIVRRADKPELNLSNYLMGERLAIAFADGLAYVRFHQSCKTQMSFRRMLFIFVRIHIFALGPGY